MKAEPPQVEQVLQRAKDRYRLLAENVSDVIFTLDLNLHYTYCSPSVERLRGFTVEEVMTQTLEQVLTPGSYQQAKKTLERQLAREKAKPGTSLEPETLELELTHKGGQTVWAEVKLSFLRDEREATSSKYWEFPATLPSTGGLKTVFGKAAEGFPLGSRKGAIRHRAP